MSGRFLCDFSIWILECPKNGQKSLGQSFLKDCRFQKDRVLCLYSLPILTLFHGLSNVPVLVVATGRPKMLSKTPNLLISLKSAGSVFFLIIFWVPLRGTTGIGTFFSCEKAWMSVPSANEGLCPFNPHKPFFEGLDPKIYWPFFGQFTHSRGSFGGFQAPQRAPRNADWSDCKISVSVQQKFLFQTLILWKHFLTKPDDFPKKSLPGAPCVIQ